jgi:hypothetical protein
VAIEAGTRQTRRAVMTAAIGAAGAMAVGALAGAAPAAAATGGNLILGHGTSDAVNDANAETRVNATTNGITAFSAIQPASGIGMEAFTTTGTGVLAIAGASGTGLDARSTSGAGAIGACASGAGLYGFVGSTAAPALGASGAGVVARAADPSKLALRVMGRAAFAFSGTATVAANKASVTVTKPGVSAASLIIATPRTNRAGVFVQSAVPGAGTFTIHLNKKVSGATVVAYMILG